MIARGTEVSNPAPFVSGCLSGTCLSGLIWRCASFVNSGSGAWARHIRHSVRRLNAVASRAHSTATLPKPRNRKLRACNCSLMIPKTGSTSCFLCLYARLASSVDIQSRWRRNAASRGPIFKLRP